MTYILVDTSTPECRLWVHDGEHMHAYTWKADRDLARGFMQFLTKHVDIDSLDGIGVFRGPGSFTGLRISMTVLNTLSDAKNIPIVAVAGDNWLQEARARLNSGENDRIVTPLYGREANITLPRK